MQELLPLAETIGARLKARGETIAIAKSSTGGLISAALLSVGGASVYFRGGGVIYTRQARWGLLEIPEPMPAPVPARIDGTLCVALGGDRARPAGRRLGPR